MRGLVSVVIMTGVGFLVGFRVQTNAGSFLAAVLLLLLFAWTLSWGFALIGLAAPNSETAQLMAFPFLFPFTFASSGFVPGPTMPGWLQAFANNQPVSQVVDAAPGPHGAAGRPPPTWQARWPGASACSWCWCRSPCASTAAPRELSAGRSGPRAPDELGHQPVDRARAPARSCPGRAR